MSDGEPTGKTAEQFEAERKARQAQARLREKSKDMKNARAQKLSKAELDAQKLEQELNDQYEEAKILMIQHSANLVDLELRNSEIEDVKQTLAKMTEDKVEYITDANGLQVSPKTIALRFKQQLITHNSRVRGMKKTERILMEAYKMTAEDLGNMYQIMLGEADETEAFKLRIKSLVDDENTQKE